MEDIDRQIQDGVQKALKEKEDKDRFAARFFWAIVGAGLSGYVVWSKLWIFSLYDNILFWAIGIGAIVGFFISELMLIAAVCLVAFGGYTWFQQSYISGKSYTISVKNDSLKNLSIKTLAPIKCGAWKEKNQQDLIVTLLPGETKEVFDGCKASAFDFSVNGVSKYGVFKPTSGTCFELTHSLKLLYTEDGWSDRSTDEALGSKSSVGAIRDCKT